MQQQQQPQTKQRKVSSYDIARHAQVSQTTVSFVLNGRTDMPISAATRDRVLAAARELGYRPNRSARAIQSGRFGCVALLLSTVEQRSVLLTGLREGILDGLVEQDLHLVLARLSDAALTDEKYVPTILREWFADGLLVNYNSEFPEAMVRLIEENQLPSVWVNLKREKDCVHPDDIGVTREAAERLLSIGHRRLAYMTWHGVAHYSAGDRIAGYEQAMAAANLAPEVIASPNGTPTLAECEEILSRPADRRPTAVVTYSEGMSNRLLLAAARLGLSVPRDLSLVCVADRLSKDSGIPIDTMVLPEYEMGKASVGMLLAKIADPSQAMSPVSLPATYESGATVAPPR